VIETGAKPGTGSQERTDVTVHTRDHAYDFIQMMQMQQALNELSLIRAYLGPPWRPQPRDGSPRARAWAIGELVRLARAEEDAVALCQAAPLDKLVTIIHRLQDSQRAITDAYVPDVARAAWERLVRVANLDRRIYLGLMRLGSPENLTGPAITDLQAVAAARGGAVAGFIAEIRLLGLGPEPGVEARRWLIVAWVAVAWLPLIGLGNTLDALTSGQPVEAGYAAVALAILAGLVAASAIVARRRRAWRERRDAILAEGDDVPPAGWSATVDDDLPF
jgi:hypothetical protein